MKRILFLVAAFFVSSSFESGVMPPGGPTMPDDGGRPVITDLGPIPLGGEQQCPFTDPNNPYNSFTAWVSVSSTGFTISLDSPVYIESVRFTNLSTGEFFCQRVRRTTNLVEALFNMSNGYWRIEIVPGPGTHFISNILVNNPAYGPVTSVDWFED